MKPTVYMTKSITPEGLTAVYNALDKKCGGKTAVKLSTGAPPRQQLSPTGTH